jgi:hypothetical protein
MFRFAAASFLVLSSTIIETRLLAAAQPETISVQKNDSASIAVESSSASAAAPAPASEAEMQESAAVEFVKQNHPELVSLLRLLKSMKQSEYDAAIREIGKVRKRLELLETRDKELHAIELESWRLQSKIDLLLARSVALNREVDAEALRRLLKRQIDIQRRRLKHERTVLVERQKQIKESLDKLESNETERVEQQIVALTKRVRGKIDKNAKSNSEPAPSRPDEKK